MVKKGLIEGVELEEVSEVVVCESCEWAKGERKLVQKVREGERCTAVEDEIHSDLWGPAPVKSINHKRYYVSFMDDYSRYTNMIVISTSSTLKTKLSTPTSFTKPGCPPSITPKSNAFVWTEEVNI